MKNIDWKEWQKLAKNKPKSCSDSSPVQLFSKDEQYYPCNN